MNLEYGLRKNGDFFQLALRAPAASPAVCSQRPNHARANDAHPGRVTSWSALHRSAGEVSLAIMQRKRGCLELSSAHGAKPDEWWGSGVPVRKARGDTIQHLSN